LQRRKGSRRGTCERLNIAAATNEVLPKDGVLAVVAFCCVFERRYNWGKGLSIGPGSSPGVGFPFQTDFASSWPAPRFDAVSLGRYRLEAIAITARAAQTTRTPARPVKIAAIASKGTEIPIAPSTISFWWSRFRFSDLSLSSARSASRRSTRSTNESITAGSISVPSSLRASIAACNSPFGTTYFLLDGAERGLLVPREDQRQRLWTTRVWPGALLVEGEIRGTWRRAQHAVRIDTWGRLSRPTRDAIEAEATALPLPTGDRGIEVVWNK
jgi:hypothetical protein